MNSNNDLLFDYITGNEIEQEIIEKLEDNEKFMTAVIKLTNDKKMYNHCSDKLKTKYNFVKFLIERFKDDIDFIISVAEEFITRGEPTDLENLELVVILSNLYDQTENETLNGYKFQACIECAGFLKAIDNFLDTNENINPEDYDLGFVFIIDNFESSPIIMDMFAKVMIEDCIYDEDNDLEKVSHGSFEKKEELEEYGETKFILDYLGCIDVYLKDYVSNNLYLLKEAEKYMRKIKNNWDNYEDNLFLNKTELTFEELEKYAEEHNLDCIELMCELGNVISSLGLKETFEKYAPLETEIIKEYSKDKYEFDDITKHNFIKHMTNYIEELFSRTNLEYEDEEYEEEFVKTKTKIINYDFEKKKVISITE